MKLKIKAGTTSKICRVRLQNIYGEDMSGIYWNSVGLSGYFIREGDTQLFPLPLSSGNIGVWGSGTFISVSDGLVPGLYELGLPNHLIQTGYKSVVVILGGTLSNLATNYTEIELDNIDYQTPIPSAVWGASTSEFSTAGTFGEALGTAIYYADIEQINKTSTNTDEYGVQWFKNGNPLASGSVTNPSFSVYNGNTGVALFTNRTLGYVNTNTGFLARSESTLATSGIPYLVSASGTIDGATRTWNDVLGKQMS